MSKPIKQACEAALESIRRQLAEADGDEETVYREFVDQIGSEVDGWEMRLQELAAEDA